MNTATAKPEIRSYGRMATLESVREHLQWAIELEQFTLPPYLCALYSLDARPQSGSLRSRGQLLVEARRDRGPR
jgi:hypothetical protein